MLRILADWGARNGLLLNGEHLQTSLPLAGFTDIQVIRVKWDIGDWRGGMFPWLFIFAPCILFICPSIRPASSALNDGLQILGLVTAFCASTGSKSLCSHRVQPSLSPLTSFILPMFFLILLSYPSFFILPILRSF
jgi:hypothetical protein